MARARNMKFNDMNPKFLRAVSVSLGIEKAEANRWSEAAKESIKSAKATASYAAQWGKDTVGSTRDRTPETVDSVKESIDDASSSAQINQKKACNVLCFFI